MIDSSRRRAVGRRRESAGDPEVVDRVDVEAAHLRARAESRKKKSNETGAEKESSAASFPGWMCEGITMPIGLPLKTCAWKAPVEVPAAPRALLGGGARSRPTWVVDRLEVGAGPQMKVAQAVRGWPAHRRTDPSRASGSGCGAAPSSCRPRSGGVRPAPAGPALEVLQRDRGRRPQERKSSATSACRIGQRQANSVKLCRL